MDDELFLIATEKLIRSYERSVEKLKRAPVKFNYYDPLRYQLYLNNDTNEVMINSVPSNINCMPQGSIYFNSKQALEECLKELTDVEVRALFPSAREIIPYLNSSAMTEVTDENIKRVKSGETIIYDSKMAEVISFEAMEAFAKKHDLKRTLVFTNNNSIVFSYYGK